jgi:hypothetical protein
VPEVIARGVVVGVVGVVGGGGVDRIVIPKEPVAVAPLESVTVMVNVLFPALAGVPLSTPVVEVKPPLKPNPVLHAPEHAVHVHVYGVRPPLAAREVLYGVDTTPLGRVLGEVITRAEEEVVPLWRVAAWLLPHAVKATNAISDTAPSVSLRRINISPSF